MHDEEPIVARTLAMKDKKERGREFDKLRLLGNFNYNMKVREEGKGELIVMRRPSHQRNYEEYLPCLYCYGFLHERELFNHLRVCSHRPTSTKDGGDVKSTVMKSLKSQCRMLLEGGGYDYHHNDKRVLRVLEVVVHSMRERGGESVKKTVQKDDLILQFGAVLLERKGESRAHDIAFKMRQLSRLVLEVRQITRNSTLTLHKIISGKYFDAVLQATKSLCGVQDTTTQNGVPMLNTPSIGLHLGHSLAKVCQLKRGRSIRLADEQMKSDVTDFHTLLRDEWTDTISSPALQTLQERKLTRKESLPTTSDLKRLLTSTQSAMLKEMSNLRSFPCPKAWRALSNTLYVMITIFNKRRGGEVARIRVRNFEDRCAGTEHNADLLESLSTVEKQLVNR